MSSEPYDVVVAGGGHNGLTAGVYLAHAGLRVLVLERSDIVGGAAVSRDDVGLAEGRRRNFYSRLQLVVSPFSKYQVLELVAKGTVRNKEAFGRNHYQRLSEVDIESFRELVELWVLDYAELFASAE